MKEISEASRYLNLQHAKNRALFHLTEVQVYTREAYRLQAELDALNKEVEEHCAMGGEYGPYMDAVSDAKDKIRVNNQKRLTSDLLAKKYKAEELRYIK